MTATYKADKRSQPTLRPRKRTCGVAGCGTPLSIYNPHAECWMHALLHD